MIRGYKGSSLLFTSMLHKAIILKYILQRLIDQRRESGIHLFSQAISFYEQTLYTTDYSIDKLYDADYDIEVHRIRIFGDSSRTYIVQSIARLILVEQNRLFLFTLLLSLLMTLMLLGCSGIVASSGLSAESTSLVEIQSTVITVAPQRPSSNTPATESTNQPTVSQQPDPQANSADKAKCSHTQSANADRIVLDALAPAVRNRGGQCWCGNGKRNCDCDRRSESEQWSIG